jgi:hypothetical protein
LLLALFGTAAYGADVYRSLDANGVVSYSDRPQGANAETVFVAVPRAGTGPAVAPQRPTRAAQDAAAGSAQAPGAEAPAAPEPTAAELRAERQQNCATARERQERYAISHRLFRTLPNGEREYLSDAQIDEARARAVADVGTWCD